MKKKDLYVSPQVEVIKMENEGVIASSVNGMNNTDWAPKSSAHSNYSRTSAGRNDLEDMINDILTIEN